VNGNPATEVIQTLTVTDNQNSSDYAPNGDQNLDSEAGLCEASLRLLASAIDNCSVGNPIGLEEVMGLELTDPIRLARLRLLGNVSDIHEILQQSNPTFYGTDNQAQVNYCSLLTKAVQCICFWSIRQGNLLRLANSEDNCGVPSLRVVGGMASGEVFFLLVRLPFNLSSLPMLLVNSYLQFSKVTITESDDNEKPVISDCPIEYRRKVLIRIAAMLWLIGTLHRRLQTTAVQ